MFSPNIIVISNNCFSKSGSNGRTLAGLLKSWPIKNVAQFYIHNELPDSTVCDNYYRVTDSEAFKAFLTFKRVGRRVNSQNLLSCNANSGSATKNRKNPLTSILRNIIWNSNRWKSAELTNWIDNFSPNVVLLQSGDSAFMLKIATELAEKRKLPLIIYNSEDYYFKNKNFMRRSGVWGILYPLFILIYRKQFKKTITYAAHSIYLSDYLKKEYDKKFNKPGTVIMTGTFFHDICSDKINHDMPIISYLGNLGLGRHESLIEIADVLRSINPDYKLDVYGQYPSDEVEMAILSCQGINYKGFVFYEETLTIMKQSDLLIHTESFSERYTDDLKHAFSTKIADSIASGSCFFVYAPKGLACTEYLLDNNAACVVTDRNDLKRMLKNIINDDKARATYTENALLLAKRNHNRNKNAQVFNKIILDACH